MTGYTLEQAQDHFATRADFFEARVRTFFRRWGTSAQDEAVGAVYLHAWKMIASCVSRGECYAESIGAAVHYGCLAVWRGRKDRDVDGSTRDVWDHAARRYTQPNGRTPIDMRDFCDDRDSVAEQVAFKIDTADWLDKMPDKWRVRAIDLASGASPSECAERWGVSRSAVSQTRDYLHKSYTAYMGE